ncbi:MAG: CDGSH iron-sulfur domain-containing protein, partial [Anaerolineae bacterium]
MAWRSARWHLAPLAVFVSSTFQEGGRVTVINTRNRPDRHKEAIPVGKNVAFCRCWQSDKFPYCDGTHRKVN